MNRVEEIQRIIQELTPNEFAEIARCVHALEQECWDHQLDQDVVVGKLDFLADEVRQAQQAGTLKEWPPTA